MAVYSEIGYGRKIFVLYPFLSLLIKFLYSERKADSELFNVFLSLFKNYMKFTLMPSKPFNTFKCFQSQTSKIELFTKLVNGLQPLTIFNKILILDVRMGSEHASGGIAEWSGKSLKDTVKILFLQ